jgi:hypothetical protein
MLERTRIGGSSPLDAIFSSPPGACLSVHVPPAMTVGGERRAVPRGVARATYYGQGTAQSHGCLSARDPDRIARCVLETAAPDPLPTSASAPEIDRAEQYAQGVMRPLCRSAGATVRFRAFSNMSTPGKNSPMLERLKHTMLERPRRHASCCRRERDARSENGRFHDRGVTQTTA